MSLAALYFHLVARTKSGRMTIPEVAKGGLYAYMAGLVSNRGCKALIINGTPNHIHLLIRVTPATKFSDLVHDLKLGATHYIKTHRERFTHFEGWGKEYAVFSCSAADLTRVISYIKNQEEHHRMITAEDEMRRFCDVARIDYYES